MLMPDELTLDLNQANLMIVIARDDPRRPMIGKAGQLLGDVDRTRHQYPTTARMLSPACIRSKPLLISSRLRTCVIIGSIAIVPSMYMSTIFGTSVRPLAPPNAVPFQTRPVTNWNGRVQISLPAPATPMMIDSPQPRWQHSSAWRITSGLP